MHEHISAWGSIVQRNRAGLFCDLQTDIVEHSKTTSPRALASAVGALLKLAKLFSLPACQSGNRDVIGLPTLALTHTLQEVSSQWWLIAAPI